MIKSLGMTFWYIFLTGGFVVVLIFELAFVSSHLTELNTNQSSVQSEIDTLKGRIEALKSVAPTITDATAKATAVLPATNTTLLVSSQIRRFALAHLVATKNFTLTASADTDSNGLNTAEADFTATGNTADVMAFVKDILNASPLLTIDNLNLVTNDTTSVAQLTILSYWSQFPTSLPSLTEPLTSLNSDEESLLSDISQKVAPTFSETNNTSTSSGTVRANPFTVTQ